ncbi:hypothetical protein EZV62_027465 [Acer yangbiense]|uniref:FAD-binding PCMH-type domain-containing protein n=1 Tax=Acer yangbiense TaxID=1000413 RepID=A0A5C7GTR7_9ROSI|nr:hypothetical protein EZV62_027465 [Acer yangbiense]
MMKQVILLVSLLLLSISWTCTSTPIQKVFKRCMSTQFSAYTKNFEIIYNPESSLYSYLLQSTIQNPRWLNATTQPLLIVAPFHEAEVQAAVLCSKKYDLQVRVRSGGHDYEGLSFLCPTPYIIIDLINMRSIDINVEEETGWVQSGATLGELYYAIAKKSQVHGFPGGVCPTIGIGGHLSGGGFGTLLRKYGLAADNVLDAYLIDVNGRILDRKAMGEELFWAIRGGGGASFGIILSWKIRLVRVPKIITGFTVSKTLDSGVTKLVHRWQEIAPYLPEDLFIRIITVGDGFNKAVQVSFNSLFLGEIDTLIRLMNKSFPELGLKAEDCIEMSWVASTAYFAGFPNGSLLEVLLDKKQLFKSNFKAKSDFVTEPIPINGLEGIWERFVEEETAIMIMDPFGGKMNEISESETPFPHRKGSLYNIQYLKKWEKNGVRESNRHVHWMRSLYKYMGPYVSKSPRAAYVNYRDLDLGTNNHDNTNYLQSTSWGIKYFKGNFKRLAQLKSKVDPENFFRSEQSIPHYK